MVDPCQTLAAAVCSTGIRVICQNATDAGTLHQQHIHTPDLAAATGEGDAVLGNVGHQFGAGLLQNGQKLLQGRSH